MLALYGYVEGMLAAQAYLPPPPALAQYHFTAFNWEARAVGTQDPPNQPPAAEPGILFLTQADTDILALSRVLLGLPEGFPPVKAYNLSHLSSEEDIDAFLSATLPPTEVILLRLLGGRESFRGGFERIVEHAHRQGKWLICVPGTDALDPELTSRPTRACPWSTRRSRTCSSAASRTTSCCCAS